MLGPTYQQSRDKCFGDLGINAILKLMYNNLKCLNIMLLLEYSHLNDHRFPLKEELVIRFYICCITMDVFLPGTQIPLQFTGSESTA